MQQFRRSQTNPLGHPKSLSRPLVRVLAQCKERLAHIYQLPQRSYTRPSSRQLKLERISLICGDWLLGTSRDIDIAETTGGLKFEDNKRIDESFKSEDAWLSEVQERSELGRDSLQPVPIHDTIQSELESCCSTAVAG